MRILATLTFFIILTSSLFAQRFHDFSIGLNQPVKYSEPSTFRKSGIDFGFGFGKILPNNLSYEFNFSVSSWWRFNYSYIYNASDVYPPIYKSEKSSRLSTDLIISIFGGYKIKKFEIKGGFAYSLKNLYRWKPNDPYSDTDRSITPESRLYSEDWYRMATIDFRLRVICVIFEKINPFIDLKTKVIDVFNVHPNSNNYGILTIGIVYNIARR